MIQLYIRRDYRERTDAQTHEQCACVCPFFNFNKKLINTKKSTSSVPLNTYILFFLFLDKCPYTYSVYKIKGVKMERVMRIELTQSAWKAEVLPLNYTRICKLVGKTGFEPATSWSQTRRSTKLSYFPFSFSALVIIS